MFKFLDESELKKRKYINCQKNTKRRCRAESNLSLNQCSAIAQNYCYNKHLYEPKNQPYDANKKERFETWADEQFKFWVDTGKEDAKLM